MAIDFPNSPSVNDQFVSGGRTWIFNYGSTQTRTNLITNPSFETDTTDWVAVGTGTTIARITSDAYVGSACVQVNKGAVVLGRIQNGYGAPTRIPVTSDLPYTFSAYVKVPSGQPSCSLRIRTREYTSAGTNQQSQVSSTVTVSDTDGWVRLSLTDTPIANTVNMDWAIEETTADARVYLVDAAIVEQSNTLRPYFDGSTADAYSGYTLISSSWTGTSHASTSTGEWGLNSTSTWKAYTQALSNATVTTAILADDAVTSAKIANGTIATEDLADSAITSAKIADGTIVNGDIASNAAISTTKVTGWEDDQVILSSQFFS